MHNVDMHTLQTKIVKLAKRQDIADLGYRKLGSLVGEPHPQKIKWHLEKLLRDGHLLKDADGRIVVKDTTKGSVSLVSIPVLGMANCGQPLAAAEEIDQDECIKVSSGCLPSKSRKYFAVKAVGNSMNQAKVSGRSINDGDMVIVDPQAPDIGHGDYVLASIEGHATIKRMLLDNDNQRIVLNPESSETHYPIVLHDGDGDSYRIHGRVVDIVPGFNA